MSSDDGHDSVVGAGADERDASADGTPEAELDELREENEDLRAEVEKLTAKNQRLRKRVEDLESLASRVDAISDGLRYVRGEVETHDERIEEHTDQILAIEENVHDLDDRTSLQEFVRDASSLKVEERAAVLIQTLYNEAQKKRRRGGEPIATGDYKDADTALGNTLDNRQLIDAMDRAATLVEGDVLQFKKEPRSSRMNSRLILNLNAGELPATVAGRKIDGGLGDD